jgi:hypothetical protein
MAGSFFQFLGGGRAPLTRARVPRGPARGEGRHPRCAPSPLVITGITNGVAPVTGKELV